MKRLALAKCLAPEIRNGADLTMSVVFLVAYVALAIFAGASAARGVGAWALLAAVTPWAAVNATGYALRIREHRAKKATQ